MVQRSVPNPVSQSTCVNEALLIHYCRIFRRVELLCKVRQCLLVYVRIQLLRVEISQAFRVLQRVLVKEMHAALVLGRGNHDVRHEIFRIPGLRFKILSKPLLNLLGRYLVRIPRSVQSTSLT